MEEEEEEDMNQANKAKKMDISHGSNVRFTSILFCPPCESN